MEIPLTIYGIILIGLAALLTYFNLDGFAHTLLGLIAGYFFNKTITADRDKQTAIKELTEALKN